MNRLKHPRTRSHSGFRGNACLTHATRGFTMVELMVAVSLSGVLIAGTFILNNQLRNNRTSSDSQVEFRQMQIDLRRIFMTARSCETVKFFNTAGTVESTLNGAEPDVGQINYDGSIFLAEGSAGSEGGNYASLSIGDISLKSLSPVVSKFGVLAGNPTLFNTRTFALNVVAQKPKEGLGRGASDDIQSIPIVFNAILSDGGLMLGCYEPTSRCDPWQDSKPAGDQVISHPLRSRCVPPYNSCNDCLYVKPPVVEKTDGTDIPVVTNADGTASWKQVALGAMGSTYAIRIRNPNAVQDTTQVPVDLANPQPKEKMTIELIGLKCSPGFECRISMPGAASELVVETTAYPLEPQASRTIEVKAVQWCRKNSTAAGTAEPGFSLTGRWRAKFTTRSEPTASFPAPNSRALHKTRANADLIAQAFPNIPGLVTDADIGPIVPAVPIAGYIDEGALPRVGLVSADPVVDLTNISASPNALLFSSPSTQNYSYNNSSPVDILIGSIASDNAFFSVSPTGAVAIPVPSGGGGVISVTTASDPGATTTGSITGTFTIPLCPHMTTPTPSSLPVVSLQADPAAISPPTFPGGNTFTLAATDSGFTFRVKNNHTAGITFRLQRTDGGPVEFETSTAGVWTDTTASYSLASGAERVITVRFTAVNTSTFYLYTDYMVDGTGSWKTDLPNVNYQRL